jgi:hypothetical protein
MDYMAQPSINRSSGIGGSGIRTLEASASFRPGQEGAAKREAINDFFQARTELSSVLLLLSEYRGVLWGCIIRTQPKKKSCYSSHNNYQAVARRYIITTSQLIIFYNIIVFAQSW